MTQLSGVVTRKGQVTLPAEIRRALGLKRGDRVTFVRTGKQVCLTRAESVVARTAGIVKTSRPAPTTQEMREAAEKAWAEEAVERMGD